VQANLPAIIQNTGFEISLNIVNQRSKDFVWTSSINLTIPQNKLVSYPNIQNSSYKSIYSVGKSLYSRYVYHYLGVNSQTGLYTFSTKKGSDNPVFGVDQIFSRPVTQSYYGGVQNSLSYKGLQLDILLQFVKQLGINYLGLYGGQPGIYNVNRPITDLARWKVAGDETNVERYSQNFGDPYTAYSNLRSSDAIISDASFVRLKNVSISYQFPSAWQHRIHLKNARLYLQAQNLFTITSYVGLDPESQGFSLPPLRMITAGLQLTL
jgi:hypothetical protein